MYLSAVSARVASLATASLIVVTGKGGVGKSVVSATLGRALHAAGRRVLLAEVDPRENLHELAGIAPTGGELTAIAPGLFLQNVSPHRVIEAIVRDHLRIEWLVQRVSASPIFQHFVDAAPGIKELSVLGHALRLVKGHDRQHAGLIDTVVLDAPATGHGLALLTAPKLASDVIAAGPFARLAGDLSGFVRDPRETAIVVVAQAEEMPVQEALELRAEMEKRIDRSPDLLVVNALYPPAPRANRRDDELTELWRRRRAINDRQLARLDAEWGGERLDLPYLPVVRGPSLVDALRPFVDPSAASRPPAGNDRQPGAGA
jgi:anion-transporting  ArsA/GET3 family ATPase